MTQHALTHDGAVIEYRDFMPVGDQTALPAHKPRWLPIDVIAPAFDPVTQVKEGPVVTVEAARVLHTYTVRAKNEAEVEAMIAAKDAQIELEFERRHSAPMSFAVDGVDYEWHADAKAVENIMGLGILAVGAIAQNPRNWTPVESAEPVENVNVLYLGAAMLLDFGISSGTIITGAFTALDDTNDAVCGYFVDDERTCLDAVQQMLDTVGAYMVPNRDGSLSVGRFGEPETGPGLFFDVDELSLGDSLDRVDAPIPAYRVTVQYARVNFVQAEGSLAGTVSAERRAYLANEWRTVVAEDAAVKTKHLNAREITVMCFFRDEADAQAEADRLLDLYSVSRERYDIAMPLSDSWAADVGLAMTLDHPRLGFAGGKAFNIIGRVDEYAEERVRFSLWG